MLGITQEEAHNVIMHGTLKEKLQARYDYRASFYGKAQVIEYNNIIYLKSYGTIVAKIEDGKPFVRGWYSQTTARHINEFLQQNGFSKMTKKEMEA